MFDSIIFISLQIVFIQFKGQSLPSQGFRQF